MIGLEERQSAARGEQKGAERSSSVRVPGGGGTAFLKVGTHCQTTVLAIWPCPPLSFFHCLYLLGSQTSAPPPRPPNIQIFLFKKITEVIQIIFSKLSTQ